MVDPRVIINGWQAGELQLPCSAFKNFLQY